MPLSVDSKLFTFEVFLVKDDRLRSDGTTGELLCPAMELLPYFLGLGSAVRVEGGSLFPLAEISRSRLLETVGLLDVPACRKMLELDICYNSNKIRHNGNTKLGRLSLHHSVQVSIMLTSLGIVKSLAVTPFCLEKLPEFRKFLL